MATNSTPEQNDPTIDNRSSYSQPPSVADAEPCDYSKVDPDGLVHGHDNHGEDQ